MQKKIIPIALALLAAVGVAWYLTHRHDTNNEIVLYGNVDLREVDLAFNDSQRVVKVLVQEGDRVRKGQMLALLDTSRIMPQLDQAEAQADAQSAVVQRLRNGSRPQEVAQARANLALAQADAGQARSSYVRIKTVFQSSSGRAVSRQDLDNAKAQWDVAQARVAVNHSALELAVIGPRKEDIAQAEAMLAADQANVALLKQQLADATLRAPLDAVVRSRIAEPGDMASPQKAAFMLAITDPKWVRAYVSEPDLGRVRPGTPATVEVDSFPGRRLEGWVGFISPVAEFTPKTVQTQELRSSLVYEVRVFVKDPDDVLRLGMPATVYLLPARSAATRAGGAGWCAPARPPPPRLGRGSLLREPHRRCARRMNNTPAVVIGQDLRKLFRAPGNGAEVHALDGVSIEVRAGELTALVGPDGAGKTTLIRLIAGLLTTTSGSLRVLGIDPAVDPQSIQDRIGYMPQKFGLYEDLSVQENLDLYADLHGVSAEERSQRYPQLMQMTDLGRFTDRLAGRLSGGMKQKLGLACTLVRSPELLLLDEPTVGVDPLSRRELWAIVEDLVREQHLTVLTSTSYLDEAERAARVLVLHEGRALAQSEPDGVTRVAAGRSLVLDPGPGGNARSVQARLLDDPQVIDAVPDGGLVRLVRSGPLQSRETIAGFAATPVEPRFEDGFMVLLRGTAAHEAGVEIRLQRPLAPAGAGAVVEVRDLLKRFGDFMAVNHVSFEVRRGEIFGLLGPNGAGKTTTFRMLCGLLPPSGGTLRVAGVDVGRAGAAARARLGYVAQKFSLYGALTVQENLEFFASAYGLRGAMRSERIEWATRQFELAHHEHTPSGELPGGFKQRLAMGAALLHEPEILFLDEPTSGADPLARRAFWRRITALAEQGVTIIVTTHFMQEAEYCDRIAIMDGGRVLAQGSPAEMRRLARPDGGRQSSMEDAFIAVVEAARAREEEGRV